MKAKFNEVKVLLRSIPSVALTLFVISIISMNLLANKSISLNIPWLALDCGIIVSWLAFLSMDVITKRFGPKASVQVSMVAILLNLIVCAVFFVAGKFIPGVWGESFVSDPVVGSSINTALDNTFGGTWYVLLGSTIASAVSSVVNAVVNQFVADKTPNLKGFKHFALRSYISTFIGPFVDNLTFAFIVSHVFFGWTTIQCITCALTGAIVETLC